jgi:lipoate-protein ligase A
MGQIKKTEFKTYPNPMFRDLCLLEFAEEQLKSDEFIFFFYTWDKPSVSLGRSQRKRQDLINECVSSDIPVSIRPSGGKAVIHDGDICFTFIARQRHKYFGGNLQESYSKVLDYILKILKEHFTQSLGWKGKIEASKHHKDTPRASTSKPINIYKQNCFSQALGSEGIIKYQGENHKVLGSAQMMYASCFLQQGSILINNKNLHTKLSFDIQSMSMTEAFNQGRSLDINKLVEDLNKKTQNSFNA